MAKPGIKFLDRTTGLVHTVRGKRAAVLEALHAAGPSGLRQRFVFNTTTRLAAVICVYRTKFQLTVETKMLRTQNSQHGSYLLTYRLMTPITIVCRV